MQKKHNSQEKLKRLFHKIATVRSSQGRWGVVSTFLSLATFFISFGLSLYALYLSFSWGHWVKIIALLFGLAGLIVGIFGAVVAVMWFFKGTIEDPIDIKLDRIIELLDEKRKANQNNKSTRSKG